MADALNAEFVEFTLVTLITGAAARTLTVLVNSVVPPAWSFTVTSLLPDARAMHSCWKPAADRLNGTPHSAS